MADRLTNKIVGIVLAAGIVLLSGCGKQPESDNIHEMTENSSEKSADQDIQMGAQINYTEQEIWCKRDENNIYGKAYIPEGGGTFPLVIFSHELGNNHAAGIEYAKRLAAEGFAVYAFDFCGGSVSYMENRSDGKNTEMSVMTEASDLEAVIEAAMEWDFADKDRIILMGGSQGGAVSAVVAARHSELVSQLILLYPALLFRDNVLEMFDSKEAVPEEFDMFGGWIRVGRNYAVDVWDYDVYSEIQKYTGSVLLLHGDKDSSVPLSYSEKASEIYKDCEFHIIENGGHEFSGQAFEDAVQIILEYLKSRYENYETESKSNNVEETEEDTVETNQIYIRVGESTLTAVLEDNESAEALKGVLADGPLTISASNYGGFEKVCSLGMELPRNDSQTTTHAGDICLYNGNQIVIFYGSNSWAYTRLGKISDADASELERILSGEETEITLSLEAFCFP